MKKVLLMLLVMLLVIGILAPQVLAQGELDTIYRAKNHLEMFEAMKAIKSLSAEVKKVESLTNEQQNNLLTGLFIRRKNPQNIDEFKTFFEEKYKGATTYMAFEPGYPKVVDNGEHGCTMTVLTNETGYVYIVAFPDGAKGGINGVKQLMEYYRADNNLYKKRVFVQAGIESTFPISCATYGSGGKYRAYLCLRTESNCYSEFQQINYQVKKILPVLFRIGDFLLMFDGLAVDIDIEVMSNKPYMYMEVYDYYYTDLSGNIVYQGSPFTFYQPYTQINTYQFMGSAFLSKVEPRLVSLNRFHYYDGTTYENKFVLEFKDQKCAIRTME